MNLVLLFSGASGSEELKAIELIFLCSNGGFEAVIFEENTKTMTLHMAKKRKTKFSYEKTNVKNLKKKSIC